MRCWAAALVALVAATGTAADELGMAPHDAWGTHGARAAGRRQLLLLRKRETVAPTASPGLSDTELSAVSKGLAMGMMSVEEEHHTTTTPASLGSGLANGLATLDADPQETRSGTAEGEEASEGELSDPREEGEEDEADDIDLGHFRDGLKNLEGDVQVPENLPPIGTVEIPHDPIGTSEEAADDSDLRPLEEDIQLNDDLPLDAIDDERLNEASAAPFVLNPLPLSHNKPSTVFLSVAVALTGVVSALGVYITWKRDRLSGRWRGFDAEMTNPEHRSLLGKQGVGSYGAVVDTEVTAVEDDGAL